MTKDYIRDNGKVRLCSRNIANMNIFESMYYHRYRMLENVVEFVGDLKESAYLIREIFIIIILPIMYPIMAWWEIKKARKEVKRHNEDNAMADEKAKMPTMRGIIEDVL